MTRPLFAAALALATLATGCVSNGGAFGPSNSAKRKEIADGIAKETPGYYVGRRYHKTDYKFWGYIRKSGQPWSTARLVMLNENFKLAPDREGGKIGSDNNYEYKMLGDFSGDTVYEPASNGFYPEFVFRGSQLLSTDPGPIYREARATDPDYRIIPKPY